MIASFGNGVLFLTFLVALYGMAAAALGVKNKSQAWVESARAATLLSWPLLTLVAISIIYLLVNNHYEVQFVYNVTSRSMPMYLKITALWGGQAGSLVLWSWLMAAFASASMLRSWQRDQEFLPWVVMVSMVTLAFFVGLTLFVENPFARFWQTASGEEVARLFAPAGAVPILPADGRGLNPLLRHPGMIIHPPMLYLGFVSFVIPFAFAVAALVTGRTDDRWIRVTRRWSLVAWMFLSLGLILGSRWAYDVLGWGGYWGWDPVEIAAFMPWLTGTAFLHSVMIQEKRGLFKRWNMILIILTYSLVIFGTFLTRSGVLSSVHAFAQSAIGPLFFGFIGLMFLISLSLLLQRWNDLRAEGSLQSMLSREALFLFNNLLFMGIFIICMVGVIYPLISELITGQKVTMGPPYYEKAAGPLFAGLLFLMGVAPLSAWGRSTWKSLGRILWIPFALSLALVVVLFINGMRSPFALLGFWLVAFTGLATVYEYGREVMARQRRAGESLPMALVRLMARNRRRYGGLIIHVSVVLMALGVIGIEMFQTETQGPLNPGESLSVGSYVVTYRDFAEWNTEDGRNVARAVMDVSKNGQSLGQLFPRRDYYYEAQQPMTIPGLRSTWEDDLYVILADWEPISSQSATFKVYHNPLVKWLWLGGWVLLFGTLIAAWPDKDPEPERRRVRAGKRRSAETEA